MALTMDRDGIYLHERGGAAKHFPTRARVVADVTGAGDMVLSVLGLAVAAGGSLPQAVELANIAAGIEVRKIGVTPVGREEILQEIRFAGHPGVGKVKNLEHGRESSERIDTMALTRRPLTAKVYALCCNFILVAVG